MSKRRTKKQKESVRHPFVLSWNSSPKSRLSKPLVKGQITSSLKAKTPTNNKPNNAYISAQEGSIKYIRHDIVRSLLVVGFILCLELVIYLAWNVK